KTYCSLYLNGGKIEYGMEHSKLSSLPARCFHPGFKPRKVLLQQINALGSGFNRPIQGQYGVSVAQLNADALPIPVQEASQPAVFAQRDDGLGVTWPRCGSGSSLPPLRCGCGRRRRSGRGERTARQHLDEVLAK